MTSVDINQNSKGFNMSQITLTLPDDLVISLDNAATALHRTRADIVRKAIEYYLEDFEDLNLALLALRDPADAVLDWDTVKRDLLS